MYYFSKIVCIQCRYTDESCGRLGPARANSSSSKQWQWVYLQLLNISYELWKLTMPAAAPLDKAWPKKTCLTFSQEQVIKPKKILFYVSSRAKVRNESFLNFESNRQMFVNVTYYLYLPISSRANSIEPQVCITYH